MTDDTQTIAMHTRPREEQSLAFPKLLPAVLAVTAILLAVIYGTLFKKMYVNWNAPDSYYSHGFLIPPICLFLAWLKRKEFLAAPQSSSTLGYPFVIGASLMALLGAFLGFNVVGQLSFLPMIVGLFLIFFGKERTKAMWFPLAFLFVMIPLPGSITQSLTLNLKLLAAQTAVKITNIMGLPLVREGSYIHWENDSLLVGDVCGGLRSLIALMAIGMLMAYFSKTRPWARGVILLMSAPIAIVANIFRILLLCVVAYFHGSEFAAGRFHDISGVLIFVVAFILFFTLEGILRKTAPEQPRQEPAAE